MDHTSMHDLMLGMFLGGMLLAAPPILVGLAIGGYVLHRRRLERDQKSSDLPGD
jgi:hypothetical protein